MILSWLKKNFSWQLTAGVVTAVVLAVLGYSWLTNDAPIQKVEARADGAVCNPTANSYKFSIERSDGTEIAFINNSGQLDLHGNILENQDNGSIEFLREFSFSCNNDDYDEFPINDANGVTIATFVYCNVNQTTTLYLRGPLRENVNNFNPDNNFNGNYFLINSSQGNPVAGFGRWGGDDEPGLVLTGCYQDYQQP